jgi:hypothetical protein
MLLEQRVSKGGTADPSALNTSRERREEIAARRKGDVWVKVETMS